MTVENNNRDFKDLKLFEIEKVFEKKWNDVLERYFLSGVEVIDKDLVYFDIQKTVSKLLKYLWVEKYFFEKADKVPDFAHTWRTAVILVRGQEIWFVWEIHPKVAKNFEISERIWFFEIDVEKLKEMVFGKIKTKDISMFQENNFDLNFVVEKDKVSASKVKATIEKAEPKLITKVELIDIYENNLVLAGKRSLTFRIYIQSMDWTLDDKAKTEIIEKIIAAVKKIWWELR